MRIKFGNILQQVQAEVSGMQNRGDLNGKTATVVGYDEEKERYHADVQVQVGTQHAASACSTPRRHAALSRGQGTRGKGAECARSHCTLAAACVCSRAGGGPCFVAALQSDLAGRDAR